MAFDARSGPFPSNASGSRAQILLVTLLAVDLLLIALHVLSDMPDGRPRGLDITRDKSLGEFFTYVKWAGLVVLMALAGRRFGAPIYWALSATFAVLLLDDALMLHETYGRVIAVGAGWEEMAGLRGQDFGELLVWALLGLPLLGALAFGMWRSPPRDRWRGAAMLALLAALVVVGGVLDMAGILVGRRAGGTASGDAAVALLAVLEDGGEMILASLAVWLGAMIVLEQPPARRGVPG